jgi:hypothetical protein
MFAIAAAMIGFGAIAALAADPSGRPTTDQPAPLSTAPLSGTASSDLARSGGVIVPPADVDPPYLAPVCASDLTFTAMPATLGSGLPATVLAG